MLIVSLAVLLTCSSILSPISDAAAQSSPVRQPDGTQGLLSPLTGGDVIYSDAHGNKQAATLGRSPGPLTPFGTPVPPNLLTPAPLLPLSPRSMASPQSRIPTAPALPGRLETPGRRPSH